MPELREYFRESNAIEDVHEESAVDESMEAWNYIKEVDELSHEVIQRAHEHIMRNRQPDIAGEYRNIQVYVGDSMPPPPAAVEYEMERLLNWSPENSLEALEWHIAFEHIHPFADGNGRVGRLIYLWHCTNLKAEPIFWRAEDREGYYDLFQSSVEIEDDTQ